MPISTITTTNSNTNATSFFSMPRIMGSIYSDNSLVYYKTNSLPSCSVGTVKNSRKKARKT